MIVRTLLAPVACLFGAAVSLRNWCFDTRIFSRYASSLPVISVGNIEVGGSGKTPLVMWIVEELRKLGNAPVVLSRGYGGSTVGPHLITQFDSADTVGDEPLMMARRMQVPVVISRRRVRGAQFIEQRKIGDVIVLDDGFQHRWLARNLDIVVSRYLSPEEARLFPQGRLREPLIRGLQRADILVLSGSSSSEGPVQEALNSLVPPQRARVAMSTSISVIRSMQSDEVLTPGPVVACCAIANPHRFFQSLRESGFELLASHSFPDHSAHFDRALEKIIAAHPDESIVITEKDAVKVRATRNVYIAKASIRLSPEEGLLQALRSVSAITRSS